MDLRERERERERDSQTGGRTHHICTGYRMKVCTSTVLGRSVREAASCGCCASVSIGNLVTLFFFITLQPRVE